MVDELFNFLEFANDFFWSYIGFIVICLAGLYFTFKSKGFQFKVLSNFKKNIKDLIEENKTSDNVGVSPFKLYFASVGGMVGMGNIVSISSAIMIGGPGSIFWIWVASLCGMLLKYSEIYLGIKYRVRNANGGYDGGPMFYLSRAFKGKTVAYLFAFILCIYGVEIYQFGVLTHYLEETFQVDRTAVIAILLALSFYTVIGGIKRLSEICSVMMPIFMGGYAIICLTIIFSQFSNLPKYFSMVLETAFTGQAQIGGFAGSTMLLTAYMGISKAVYSGDIGVGYDSVVQSETRIANPKKQAQIAIYALFTDTFICSLTTLVILVSGGWYELNNLDGAAIIPTIFSNYFNFPYTQYFMAVLLFFAGFTTIIAFYTVGLKSANFLSPKFGKYIYIIYSFFAFIYFANSSYAQAALIMSLACGLLLIINVFGMLKLRNQIEF
ncbi:MAG: alsT [Rickettsiaceae bacterium]|jgi:AGCS family alanine or glycine:cation symporter|nr:alsT [Rickettsiaceae bacterium]